MNRWNLGALCYPPKHEVSNAAFITNDKYRRLKSLGVTFRGEPTSVGPVIAVLFADTGGNLMNLVQPGVTLRSPKRHGRSALSSWSAAE